MASTETEVAVVPQQQQVVKKQKKLKPARKQVTPGQVEKKEAPQTGKEYSAFDTSYWTLLGSFIDASCGIDIWYNKWAGGDREDSYSKYVQTV